ncbi:WXG100 family type VII secretion target [Streptomyces sp. NPDC046197]|uniref:WXG100 family type VII secretion target n=1 Tax=Streptomyces sp. NPDC046197 TaxID=3154337 RepID=UPI003406D6ED
MSGDDKAPKQLTDQQRVDAQVGQVDALTQATEVMHDAFGLKRTRVLYFGQVTDFEEHRLNDMIDLVEHANPADLEHAGATLAKASAAIKAAAEELRGHLKHAGEDWKGEAGTAFQKWGEKLATHTEDLATYADGAGVQVTAAATGLASVRKSMPPRDTRPDADQKSPGQLPAPKQVAGNKEYAEAVRVEKDRQEAINQMNRLASFYSVSGERLQSAQPPVFEAMPSVGMPPPPRNYEEAARGGAVGSTAVPDHRAVTSAHENRHVAVSGGHFGNDVLPGAHPAADTGVARHAPAVGTEINTVGTLPPETVNPVPVTPPTAPGPAPHGPSAGPFPPLGTGVVPPVFGGPAGRPVGTAGPRAPISTRGRVTAAEGPTAGGRGGRGPVGPVGRASTVAEPGARGPAAATGRSLMGRGVTGGMPRATDVASPRTGAVPGGRVNGVPGQPGVRTGPGATGAARTGGVVGGRPSAEAGPSAKGARVPRGTVIGGEDAPGARAAGERPGQRGVIGTNTPAAGAGRGQAARRAPSTADRAGGAPTSRVGAGGDGATSGSSGLTRGSVGEHGPERAVERQAGRPRNSAEDKKRSRRDARRGDAPSTTD